MKANELRIGNWIKSQFGGIQQAVDVMCDGINTLKYEGINYEFIEPIPLTEEWLLKFGFDKNQDLLVRGLIMRYSFTNQTIELIRYETLIDFEIKHVHQLQNLYFALTGEELVVKE